MPLSHEEIEALVNKKFPKKRDKRPAYIRQLEDPDGLEQERLERIRERYPVRSQIGPVRFVEKSLRCARRGCTNDTNIKVQGIPYCMVDALRILNELCIEKGILA